MLTEERLRKLAGIPLLEGSNLYVPKVKPPTITAKVPAFYVCNFSDDSRVTDGIKTLLEDFGYHEIGTLSEHVADLKPEFFTANYMTPGDEDNVHYLEHWFIFAFPSSTVIKDVIDFLNKNPKGCCLSYG